MSSNHLTFALANVAATDALAANLATLIEPGMRIYLEGDLGAGKTTFTRALLRALGHQGPVKSPTYTLVEIYVFSGYILYHFDFYRMNHPAEWLDAGLDEHFNADSVCVVEWPDKAGDTLPAPDLTVRLQFDVGSDGETRKAHLAATSERGERCLEVLRTMRHMTRAP